MAVVADAARRLGEADARGAEDGSFVAVAEGGEAFNLADGLMRKRGERRFGVDEELGDAVLDGNLLLGVRAEILAERFDRRFVDRESGGRFVTAVADEVLVAGSKGGVEVETAGAAAGAHAGFGA